MHRGRRVLRASASRAMARPMRGRSVVRAGQRVYHIHPPTEARVLHSHFPFSPPQPPTSQPASCPAIAPSLPPSLPPPPFNLGGSGSGSMLLPLVSISRPAVLKEKADMSCLPPGYQRAVLTAGAAPGRQEGRAEGQEGGAVWRQQLEAHRLAMLCYVRGSSTARPSHREAALGSAVMKMR